MPSTSIVLTGPAGCGKTGRLLDRYRAELAGGGPGAAIWLAPTWRAADELRRRLLAGLSHGCFSPGVTTFDRFAESVLEAASEAIRPLSPQMKRQLIRQLIRQQHLQGRLAHFGPIAETSGLVDLLCELISELKRLEIWPEHLRRACDARGMTQKDLELLAIYDEYQRCLRDNQLYDAEGRFWSARDRLDQGQRRPLERLRLVVADGFTDFTRTQHEILEILARRIDELWITLPLEPDPRRADLFGKPLATLAELRRRHRGLVVEELPRAERPSWPALAHLEKTLFADPRRVSPAEDLSGVEILAAAQPLGEIEQIAARIKRLLTQGDERSAGRPVRPEEIAVVFRSPEDSAALVDEVFGAMGIPLAAEAGTRLDRSPLLGALVSLLRLDLDDWPFGRLLQVLSSNYFHPTGPEWQDGKTAAAIERTVRRLQVPSGRDRLLAELDAEARSSASGAALGADSRTPHPRPLSPQAGRGEDAWGWTLGVLRRLAAALEALPQQAGPGEWAEAWDRLAGETGLLLAIGPDDGGAPIGGVPDRVAWARLRRALAAAESFGPQLRQSPIRWDRRQAIDALLDILASERVGHAEDESGRVRVISAASARALQIPYLFLAGLSEKAFPPPQRIDRLYSEAEYQRLIDEGLPLVARRERNHEEMLLFYEAMTRATRRLVLSYPALDASAQPLAASPFLEEMDDATGGRIPRTVAADLSPIPQGDEPLSLAEFRVKAVATALEGDVALLAGLLRDQPQLAQGILAGIATIDARQDRERFGPAEGILDGQAARAQLSARFPHEHVFSVTELERYASCPYCYFLERVLRIEPVEEMAVAVDYLERGQLAHEVLASFHRRVNAALGRPASPVELEPDEYVRFLGKSLDEALGSQHTDPLRAALREVDRRLLTRWLTAYRAQHEAYDAGQRETAVPLVPEWFEVSFGRRSEGDDEREPSTDRPLEFCPAVSDGSGATAGLSSSVSEESRRGTSGQASSGTPQSATDGGIGSLFGNGTVRVSGRIDRIDKADVDGTTVFNIVDYKTGGPITLNSDTIAAGTTLQLPLYALAVAELMLDDRDALPGRAGYWYLRDKGFKPALEMYRRTDGGLAPTSEWEEIRRRLDETVVGLARGIRTGQFPVFSRDDNCTGRCPYATVCRINHIRSLEKTWLLKPFRMCPQL